MILHAALLAAVAAPTAQETKAESPLHDAVRATIAKGFRFTVKPAASLPNFNSAREELAGAAVQGEYHDGLYHAKDGLYEIYRKGDKVAVRTERGWLPLDQFLSPLRQDARQAFEGDGGRWSRGNVTQGRKALEQIIRLTHLVHRADVHRLAALESAFTDLRAAGGGYEGDLTDLAAFQLLQGPFEDLVRRGTLSFQGLSGIGRVVVQEGVVRKISVKAGGKYGFYNEEDNARRKGFCTLELLVSLDAVGETTVEVPKEAAQILAP